MNGKMRGAIQKLKSIYCLHSGGKVAAKAQTEDCAYQNVRSVVNKSLSDQV